MIEKNPGNFIEQFFRTLLWDNFEELDQCGKGCGQICGDDGHLYIYPDNDREVHCYFCVEEEALSYQGLENETPASV